MIWKKRNIKPETFFNQLGESQRKTIFKIHKFNNDVKNKWVIIKGLIRKDPQRRSAFPGKIVFDDKTMTNEKDTTKKKYLSWKFVLL